MTGDLIDEYLARLRASLRTPPHRTAEILAEAEDHLRESSAAGETLGLSEREAQETAIAAFGPIHPPGWTGVPGLALVAGAMVTALGYTLRMVLTIMRQGEDARTDMGTTDGEAHYA